MKRYVLDTSALLTLRDDEPGAERVAEVLHLAAKNKARCYGCFISLMEVLYRVWRDEDEADGRLAYQQPVFSITRGVGCKTVKPCCSWPPS